MSESVTVGEIEARHGLIDDGDVGGVVILVFIPNFALGDRNANAGVPFTLNRFVNAFTAGSLEWMLTLTK